MASLSSFAVLGSVFLPNLAPIVGIGLDTVPPALLFFANHQVYGFVGYMALNLFAQKLVATGAYEIYLGNERIFSALEAGGVPSVDHISQLLKARGLKASQGSKRLNDK